MKRKHEKRERSQEKRTNLDDGLCPNDERQTGQLQGFAAVPDCFVLPAAVCPPGGRGTRTRPGG